MVPKIKSNSIESPFLFDLFEFRVQFGCNAHDTRWTQWTLWTKWCLFCVTCGHNAHNGRRGQHYMLTLNQEYKQKTFEFTSGEFKARSNCSEGAIDVGSIHETYPDSTEAQGYQSTTGW